MNEVNYKWQSNKKNKELITFTFLVVASFAYYYLLSAKSWTWIFASFDSGDWLAASQIWMTPQPYGSPLYILLGHFMNIFPFDLVDTMTIGLSVIPASITVGIVYLIIRKLGYEQKHAYLGSSVLLACGLFLSQATVLEEYAIATMFVTLAFYCYIGGKKKLTAVCLGLGASIHIIIAPIAVLWVIVHYKQWREWVKPTTIFFGICITFYSVILILMGLDTPNVIAGDLSLSSINAYLGSTQTLFNISLHDAPERLLQAISVLLLGFGVCLIPLVYGFKRPWNNIFKVMFITTAFCVWLYITNTDMTTWTFMTFALPIVCIVIAIGLSKMPKWCSFAVIGWVCVAMIANGLWMNADTLTKQNQEPVYYYNATMEVPDGSAIVCNKGGAYGMTVIYTMASGKNITPLFLQHEVSWDNAGYLDYLGWIQNHHSTQGDNWIEQVNWCINSGSKEVYIPYLTLPPEWQEKIDLYYETEYFNNYYRKVVSVYEVPHYTLD